MNFFLLFAEVVDPITNSTGWAASGITGLVLGWLVLKHIPQLLADSKATAKEHVETVKQLLDRHDAQVEEARVSHDAQLKAAQETFRSGLDKMLAHCEAETRERSQTFRDEISKLAAVIEKGHEVGKFPAGKSGKGVI